MHWDDPLTAAFWIQVGIAVACGGVIGLERQLRGKPAGIRTSILICLGTVTFMRVGGILHGPGGDPSRVLGQIVTGVGFLGAGVILTREGLVKGVTSAAVIWMLAAIGTAIGSHRYGMGIALTVVTVVALVLIEVLEHFQYKLRRGVHAHANDRDVEPDPSPGQDAGRSGPQH